MVPIARFLLRAGVSFREFEDVARAAYVQVASTDYGLRGRWTNVSRVAAMTGISRKQVRALRESIQRYGNDARVHLSPLGDLLHCWSTDPAFRDMAGKPMLLRFAGDEPSFESLVRRRLADLPANAIKVELMRCGAISQADNGLLKLERREVVPGDFADKLISSLSFNLAGLASTIAFNSNPDRMGSGRIERFAQSGPLSSEDIRVIRDSIRMRIVSFTRELDDLFPSTIDASMADQRRVGVGVYYYEEDPPE